ncbi:MAG: hypothetical protein ACO1OG_12030 [Devosia sp.]
MTITDDDMRGMLDKAQPYTIVLLSRGPNYRADGDRSVIWEHGRRNFELRAAGKLAIVVPMGLGDPGQSDVVGLCIMTTSLDETAAIMATDPAVIAGWLVPEIRAGHSFPGDALPA